MTLPYRPDIDGLRGVSIALVLLYHAGIRNFEGGFLGVDVFFVISGWLITQIIVEESSSGTFSLAGFYERRARRLLPALFVVLLASCLLGWSLLAPDALLELGRHVVASCLFFMNVQLWMERGYFATGVEVSPLFHLWSLAVEEQFYLLFPVALLLILRRGVGFTSRLLTLTALVSFLASVILSASGGGRDAAFFLLPGRAWELLAGSVAALQAERIDAFAKRFPEAGEWAALAGLLLLALGVALIDDGARHPGYITLLPVGGSLLMIMFAPGTRLGKLLAGRVLVGLGLISYAAYLVHQPIFAFARIYRARELNLPESHAALLISLLCAWGLHVFIETPVRRKRVLTRRLVFRFSAVGLAMMAGIGTTFAASGGFPLRLGRSEWLVEASIQAGRATRAEQIGLGRCHYHRVSVRDLARFLEEWACLPHGKRPVVLVVGDSVAADRSWMLRTAGFPVGNIGGMGCGLLPSEDRSDPCNQILKRAKQLAVANKVDGIVLSNRWAAPPSRRELLQLVAFWKSTHARLLVFSPMPMFPEYRRRIAKHIREGRPLTDIVDAPALYAERMEALAVLRESGIPVVDTRTLLCGATKDPCPGFSQAVPLLSDEVHALPLATRIMANRVAEDPVWLSWFESLKRLEPAGRISE